MSEEKNIKELENSSVALTLTVPSDRIEADYRKALDKYVKNIQIKGFRKGHVPVSVLEAKYGESLRAESTFDTMEAFLKENLDKLEQKDKPLPYSTPELQDEEKLLPFKPNADVTYTVEYDIMPVFELPPYKGLTFTLPKVTVGDADVTKELDHLREQNAMVVDKKGSAENDNIVDIDYVELDDKGEEVASTARKDFTFTVGSGYNYYEIDKDVLGMKAGDEKVIEKTYPKEFKTTDLAGKTIKLKVTMKSVKRRDVPALDDDFAQDVKEEYKTVADLTKATREKLEGELKQKLDDEKFTKLADQLAENVKIALPKSMVDFELERDWKNYTRQSGLSEEQIEKFLSFQKKGKEDLLNEWRPEAEKALKVQLVMDRIKDTEKFEVSKEELDKACEEQMKDVTDENQKTYYRTMIEDDMKFRKVSEFLTKNNTFADGPEKSFDDYMNGKEEEAKTEEAGA
nr:hypothetical protein [uncultured bacterium]